ncbi:MAG: protein translocase subunit SecD [Actinomycetota bacterium]|nr:protein translocase subunit SecD [Actinomycetota bacterium]
MSDRQRNFFVLLLVAGLLIASAVVLAMKPTKLGLDLQGGVELVYQVKARAGQPPPKADTMQRTIDVMRDRVDQLGVAEPEIQQSGNNQINVALPDVSDLQEAIDQVGTVAQLAFYDWETNVIGPDGKPDPTNVAVTGGPAAGDSSVGLSLYDALLRAEKRPAKVEPDNSREGPLYYAVDRKAKRVFGLGEESRDQALLNVPANRREKADVITVKADTVILRAQKPADAPKPNSWFVFQDDVALQGKEIKDPEQNFDQGAGGSGAAIVTFNFTDEGRQTWERVTKAIAQRGQESVGVLPGQGRDEVLQHFAIVLDNELVSSPTIDFQQYPDGIDGRNGSQIEGGFTPATAQELANILKTGALPVRLELISNSQVSATLGRQALNQGLAAGAAGFVIVALFLLIFYRVLGVIAVAALAVYALYFFALIKAIPVVLTLPGIAGLILTLGVAADANIVIFERVKEEIRGGRSIASGIATGYKKGLTAIIDANVVTIMVAFILFVLATSGVKGFALTLGLGVIVSLFTAVLATQAILGVMGKSRMISKPSALGAGKPKGDRLRLDYMGYSRWFFSASGVILLVCALALGSKGINFGIDFESGTRISVELKQNLDEDAVRDVIAKEGLGAAEIQKVTGDENAKGASAFRISTDNLKPAEVTKVSTALEREYDLADTPSSQSIGPTFGATVANSAVIAIIASLFVISAYIALRFEPKYAVPVLIAVMHDILITAGVYALLGQEVTTATVAALLTVLGFSLYDTIIVFDRIRENVPRMPRAAFSQIVNRSMSEVIVRSLATSFCSGLPVLALLLFGGETLQAFAFALLIGTISGTYSSVFIAGPVLTAWKEREPVYRRRHARIAAEHGGVVPAYATGSANEQVDPDAKRKLRRSGRLTAPDDPDGTNVSREEFEELVRDLHVDPVPRRTAVADRAKPKPKAAKPAAEPARDDSADALPEDVTMPPAPKEAAAPKRSKGSSAAAKRRSKHGRPR